MRAQVIQVRCDRCKRVEVQAVTANGNGSATTPGSSNLAFRATFEGQELVYEDLCTICRQALRAAWRELKEWKRGVQHQFGPMVDANKAPPLQPPPNYTPPIPHSPGKK